MSKKNKGVFVDSVPPYGVGGVVDFKAMQRHQILMQDYEELRKTGDDDDHNLVEAVKFEEAKTSLIRGIDDEKRNELKFSICRNAGGEMPARVGKRKISWQDPVALQV